MQRVLSLVKIYSVVWFQN